MCKDPLRLIVQLLSPPTVLSSVTGPGDSTFASQSRGGGGGKNCGRRG